MQYGPEYASALQPGATDKPTGGASLTSVAPVPTQSYAPARSKNSYGVSVYNVKTSASAGPYNTDSLEIAAPSKAAAVSSEAPAAPAITASPSLDDAAPEGSIISTKIYTEGGVVYEVAIEEVVITTTVDSAFRRRHVHAHRRRVIN